MNGDNRLLRFGARYIASALLGLLFALSLHQVWTLQGRWFYVVVIAIVLVSIALMFVSVLRDFMILAFLFAMPLASFVKWFFPKNLRLGEASSPTHNATIEGVIGIGIMDFIIAGLLVVWFARVFISKTERFPKLCWVDFFIFLLLFAYVVSIFYAPKANLAIASTIFLLKFLLLYFCIVQCLKEHHLPWFVGSLLFASLLEGGLGIVQHTTGKLVGIALDKGGGDSLDYQYMVLGTEQWFRASGTAYDTHTLGLYLAMVIPFLFSMTLWPDAGTKLRVLCLAAMTLALATLIMTFTRSGWVACAASMLCALLYVIVIWRDKRIIPILVGGSIIALILSPWALSLIIDRFVLSPIGTLTVRFEGFDVASYIWSRSPIFGSGAGNYIELLYKYNYGWNSDIIVHNTILWLGVETGLIGVVGFYGIIAVAMRRFWVLARSSRSLASHLAFGGLVALTAFVVEGMATPMHREPLTYTMFWFVIALSVVLPRIQMHADRPVSNVSRQHLGRPAEHQMP